MRFSNPRVDVYQNRIPGWWHRLHKCVNGVVKEVVRAERDRTLRGVSQADRLAWPYRPYELVPRGWTGNVNRTLSILDQIGRTDLRDLIMQEAFTKARLPQFPFKKKTQYEIV